MGWLVRMSYIARLCWNDLFLSFAALFSSSKRRQLELSFVDSSPHRPIFGPANTSGTNGSGDELEQDVQ